MKNHKADFIIPDEIVPLIQMIESDGFEIYVSYLKRLRELYTGTILAIDPRKSERLYTEHDINRKVLEIIESLIATPIDSLRGLWAAVQEDEKQSKKVMALIGKIERLLGIGESSE